MHAKSIILSIALLAQSLTAIAAQQCLTTSGQYGRLAVSSCADDFANGILNPLSWYANQFPAGYPFADGSAFGLGAQIGLLTCTFTLSHPVLTSSVRIDADVFNTGTPVGDQLTVELDSNPYLFVASDILQTPLSGVGVSTEAVVASPSGSIVNAPGTSSSSGTMQLANNAPVSFSTIKVSMQADGAGTAIRLCVDDAPAIPAAANPVPSSSTTTLAMLSLGLVFAGMRRFRRRTQG